ncbi:unnamed protein product [Larinioides sclopetarius]|uniref:Uncharacterized protein n=1 Tax=Larinioides sclopetarius TaxID=280406 RepID=A0AAV2A7Q9_9ARAC
MHSHPIGKDNAIFISMQTRQFSRRDKCVGIDFWWVK